MVLLASIDAGAAQGRWYTGEQVEQGARVFDQSCAESHGTNAEAMPNWRETTPEGKYPPPLNGTAHAWHHSLDVLRRQINLGGVPLGGVMPGFKDKLSAAEVDAAIAYFQSKWSDEVYAIWLGRNGDGESSFVEVATAIDDKCTGTLRERFPELEIGPPADTPV